MDISSMNAAHVPAPAEPPSAQPANAEQRNLIQAVKAVDATELFGQENELTFLFDRSTRRAVVRIVNRESGQVVQQIPAEKVLRMAEEIKGR